MTTKYKYACVQIRIQVLKHQLSPRSPGLVQGRLHKEALCSNGPAPAPPHAKAGGSLGLKEAEFSQSLESGHCGSSGEQGQHSDCGESGSTGQQRVM